MKPYGETARRYAFVLIVIFALTWGVGAYLAYIEYTHSFEADAVIWTDRQSSQFTSLSPQDPGFSSLVTPAEQQASLLRQLLVTRSVLMDTLDRAGIARPADDDQASYDAISKRFRVDVLGTNLIRVSYRATDPQTAPKMLVAALAERQDRLRSTQSAATSAAATYYKAELDVAQNRVVDAQRELDNFSATHRAPLSAADDYQLRTLQIAVDDARARVSDLRTRIDGSSVLPDILKLADALDFQVIDEPLADARPSGGGRPAALIIGSAGAAGVALAALVIVLGTLLRPGSARRSASQEVARSGEVAVST